MYVHTEAAHRPKMAGPDDSLSPCNKRRKYNELESLIDTLDESLRVEIKEALLSLCEDKSFALAILKIKLCNASTGYGIPFSAAFCDTEVSDKHFFPFGSIFTKGLQMLDQLLDKRPEAVIHNENLNVIFIRLLSFLTNKDLMNFVKNLAAVHSKKSLNNETEVCIAVAEHIFGKLALHNKYLLDHRYKGSSDDRMCRCGCKTPVSKNFGDTSVGEETVWHGKLDIVLGCLEEQVPIIVAAAEELGLEYKTPMEVEYKNLSQNEMKHQMKHQMIAQTIVFSFLQKKRLPKATHHLIPCIGISPKEVTFYFYDSENDVLLQSVAMPLSFGDSVCYSTLLAIWLVVNYKYLGTGLAGELQDGPTADFFTLAKTMLDVYNNNLCFGNVWDSSGAFELHPTRIPETKFLWPVGIQKVGVNFKDGD